MEYLCGQDLRIHTARITNVWRNSTDLINRKALRDLFARTLANSNNIQLPFELQLGLVRGISDVVLKPVVGACIPFLTPNSDPAGRNILFGAQISIDMDPGQLEDAPIKELVTNAPQYHPSLVLANFVFLHEWRHLGIIASDQQLLDTEQECEDFAEQEIRRILRSRDRFIITDKILPYTNSASVPGM